MSTPQAAPQLPEIEQTPLTQQIASLIKFLTLLILGIISFPYIKSYTPGQEDLSLIMESVSINFDYWMASGYSEWFMLHPGQQEVVDYEIRPLTNLITHVIWSVAEDTWPVYILFNIFLIAAVNCQIFSLLSQFKRSFLNVAIASFLLMVLNPAFSFESITNYSFFQVSLSYILFMCMLLALHHKNMLSACGFLLIAIFLKESTWFYAGIPLLYGAMLFIAKPGEKTAWGLLQGTIAAALSFQIFCYLHPDQSFSTDISIFSQGFYEEGLESTIEHGLSLLPTYNLTTESSLQFVCMLALIAYLIVKKHYLVASALICSYISAIIFHEELRWTFEFSIVFVLALLLLPRMLSHITLIFIGALWAHVSIPVIKEKVQSLDEYGFYTRHYQTNFETAQRLVRVAGEAGADSLFVVNDSVGMNGDYFSLMMRQHVNWISLNSIDYQYRDVYANWQGYPAIEKGAVVLNHQREFEMFGFPGYSQTSFMEHKLYGNDTKVLSSFAPHYVYPEGDIRISSLPDDMVRLDFDADFTANQALAYVWPDSRDAWLYTNLSDPQVHWVSQYVEEQENDYAIRIPTPECDTHDVIISPIRVAQDSQITLNQDECIVEGIMHPGDLVSVQVMSANQIVWSTLLRAPGALPRIAR